MVSLIERDHRLSLPLRERGLKFLALSFLREILGSLPLRERGLKCFVRFALAWSLGVAPLAGAWVEIAQAQTFPPERPSLPLRERGLKCRSLCFSGARFPSLPLRERGLKFLSFPWPCRLSSSLPLRERGLKSISIARQRNAFAVAPLAGAWVEMSKTNNCSVALSRRSPCGSVG